MSGVNFNVTTTLAGSGSSGGVSYGSSTVTDYSGYADAAAATPVDMTGGSPTLTLTSTTSTPLRGASSMLITKDAANRQGEGFADAITIDDADKCKVLTIAFDYEIASGAYATGDLAVYVYDVTNSTLIQPSGYQIQNVGIESKHIATFQTTTSTSYRWGFHVASTSASAYTVKIDNVVVGPQVVQYGAPVTDWTAYTPTFNSTTGHSATASTWRRVGDSMEITGYILYNNTGGAGSISVTIPSGYTIDTGKVSSTTPNSNFGIWGWYDNAGSAASRGGFVSYSSSTSLAFIRNDDSNNFVQSSAAASDRVNWNVIVPITGWSSSVQMSNDTDTRVVAAIVTGDPASATVGNPIIVPTVGYDSHGAYSASTGRYTVPVPGLYKMFGALQSASSATTLTIYKNAASTQLAGNLDSNGEATYAGMVNCVAGDIIDIRPGGTVDATSMSLNIERLSGPSAIAASESVNARYYASATGISGSLATISWTTKDYDSHLGMSSGTYTVPVAGKYQVNTALAFSGTFALNNQTNVVIQKNGATVSETLDYAAGAETAAHITISDAISCLAGDTIRVQASSGATGPGIVSSNTKNYISIARLGN